MKIDSQNQYFRSVVPSGNNLSSVHPTTRDAQAKVAAEEELSPQEKLRQLLEEKKWMTEAIQSEPAHTSERLGGLLDLRV